MCLPVPPMFLMHGQNFLVPNLARGLLIASGWSSGGFAEGLCDTTNHSYEHRRYDQ